MSGRGFLDTNIFVYTFDAGAPAKREVAVGLVSRALADGGSVISHQVIGEFINVATRKFATPMSSGDAFSYLQRVLAPLCRLFPDVALYGKALALRDFNSLSFYDSLIVAAALRLNCDVLYTEDLQHGREIEGLEVRNPFLS